MAGKWFATVDRQNWPDDKEASVLANWEEPYRDRRQEIVIIGYVGEMDEAFLKECFDACLHRCRDGTWRKCLVRFKRSTS